MSAPDIVSGEICVGDQAFADWFNAALARRGDFLRPIEDGAFRGVFDHVGDLWAPAITLAQFVAFFALFYNETGATLRPLAELGGPQYCFETHLPGGASKLSYNRHPNRLAGDQLLERGLIGPADVAAWNGIVWPAGAPDEVKKAAEQCDFFHFRGRGYIQVTWRTTYERDVDPLLAAAGLGSCDSMTTAELDAAVLGTPSVSLGMVRAFFQVPTMTTAFALVDRATPLWAPTGTHVSGSAAYGNGLYTRRCQALYQALLAAGYDAR